MELPNLKKMKRSELIDFGSKIHETEANNQTFVTMCQYNTKVNIIAHIEGIWAQNRPKVS